MAAKWPSTFMDLYKLETHQCLAENTPGRYKTWTLDWTRVWTGLEYGLDYGLDFGLGWTVNSVLDLLFNTILIPCLLVLLMCCILSECMVVGRNSVKLNLVERGLKSKFGVNP